MPAGETPCGSRPREWPPSCGADARRSACRRIGAPVGRACRRAARDGRPLFDETRARIVQRPGRRPGALPRIAHAPDPRADRPSQPPRGGRRRRRRHARVAARPLVDLRLLGVLLRHRNVAGVDLRRRSSMAARRSAHQSGRPAIIFVRRARGGRLRPRCLDYLLKPVTGMLLTAAMCVALRRSRGPPHRHIAIAALLAARAIAGIGRDDGGWYARLPDDVRVRVSRTYLASVRRLAEG